MSLGPRRPRLLVNNWIFVAKIVVGDRIYAGNIFFSFFFISLRLFTLHNTYAATLHKNNTIKATYTTYNATLRAITHKCNKNHKCN